jgi:hypothetical protein
MLSLHDGIVYDSFVHDRIGDGAMATQARAAEGSSDSDFRGGRRIQRWNRMIFTFFGPAQIGDLSAPIPAFDPDPPCSRCGSIESAHVRHRMADGKMLCQCPAPVG